MSWLEAPQRLPRRWWLPGAAGVAVGYAWLVTHAGNQAYVLTAALIAGCLGLLLAFTRYAGVFALLLLTLPLSVEMPLDSADNKLLFPSEALMAVLGVAFSAGTLLRRPPAGRLLRHPLTILVLLYFGWMAVTTAFSGRLVVSLKYTIVNGAYVAIFYLLAYDFLRRDTRRIPAFFFLYGVPMLGVIGYALYHHSTIGFYHDASGIVVRPFFSDHTLYSACLGLLLPAFVAFAFKGEVLGMGRAVRLIAGLMAVIMAVGIFFSFSRAAWIGLGAALGFYGLLRWRVRPVYLAVGLGATLLLAVGFQDALLTTLKLNRHQSTGQELDLAEQTMSVTNISSDVSNAERLNRWSCAWRMFRDRPLTGFGPGTYQFEYLAYQRPEEMTRISVTSPYNNVFGRGGSAHSEYLLALADMGLPGFLLFTAIVLTALGSGMRAYYRAPDARTRLLLAVTLTSLVGFVTHVFFNNFLNNNKAAALFWGILALGVLLEAEVGRKRGGVEEEVGRKRS